RGRCPVGFRLFTRANDSPTRNREHSAISSRRKPRFGGCAVVRGRHYQGCVRNRLEQDDRANQRAHSARWFGSFTSQRFVLRHDSGLARDKSEPERQPQRRPPKHNERNDGTAAAKSLGGIPGRSRNGAFGGLWPFFA